MDSFLGGLVFSLAVEFLQGTPGARKETIGSGQRCVRDGALERGVPGRTYTGRPFQTGPVCPMSGILQK